MGRGASGRQWMAATGLLLLRLLLVAVWCPAHGSRGEPPRMAGREEVLEVLRGRYNYASCDCAARVLATNKGCKAARSVLQSTKDTYLLNLCAYPAKHIVLELCQDVRIDTVVLANFEYFSSMVKDFRVSASKKYPVTEAGWRQLGRYTAENSRREQVFPIHGTGYARYLRLDLDTHYGNEFYCLLSVIRVYGKTMMEDFEESAGGGGRGGDAEGRPSPVAVITVNVSDTIQASSSITSKGQSLSSSSSTPTRTASRTVVSSAVGSPRSPASTTRTVGLSSSSVILHVQPLPQRPPMDERTDFGGTVHDLLQLFKEEAERDVCHATSNLLPAEIEEDAAAESPETFILDQENVFKAIYDRLQQLERNVTRSSRHVNEQLRRLEGSLRVLQDEISLTEEKTPLGGTASKAADGATGHDRTRPYSAPPRLSFRARLAHHLERRHANLVRKTLGEVDDVLRGLQNSDRLLFWLAVFVTLQVVGLTLVILALASLGRPAPFSPPRPGHRPDNQIASPTPSATTAASDRWRPRTASPHERSDRESLIVDETESAQVVPGTHSAPAMSPQTAVRLVSSSAAGSLPQHPRGMSPLKGDLIETAARPLLLDESEPELIDATYVPSPLSSDSSPSAAAAAAARSAATMTRRTDSPDGSQPGCPEDEGADGDDECGSRADSTVGSAGEAVATDYFKGPTQDDDGTPPSHQSEMR